MGRIVRADRFRRLGRLAGLLAVVLGFAIVAGAQPCVDDLQVGVSRGADCRCSTPSDGDAPSDCGPAVCPCVCCFGVVVLDAAVAPPTILVAGSASIPSPLIREFALSPATPPPRA